MKDGAYAFEGDIPLPALDAVSDPVLKRIWRKQGREDLFIELG